MVASLLACCVAGVKAQDTDGDGMPDAWETTWHLNPNDPADAAVDFDLDGLTSLQEYQLSLQGKGQGPIGVWTWEEIEFLPPGPPVPTDNLKVTGLNDHDDALISDGNGYKGITASVRRASDGAWRTLSTVNGSGSWWVDAVDLNNNGEVVGSVMPEYYSGPSVGFRKKPFEGAATTDVEPYYLPGEAATPVGSISAINNSGDIVGTRANGSGFFLKSATGLVPTPSGWGALRYSALNNRGQAAGSEAHDPMGFGATSHFVLSGLSSWHAPFPAYAANEINTSEIDPPEMSLETLYAPRFLNDRGEFADVYRWRIGNPEDEEKTYNQGIYHFDGTGYKPMLPTTGWYTMYPKIYDMNNHSQALISGSDEYGESMAVYLHRKGVNVPISALSSMVPDFTYGYSLPTQINNRSTIAGITEKSLYFLRLSQDEDGDGMPDDWEEFHQLNRLDPNDAGIDSDGDGYPNLMEFRFGGDPGNPAVHSGPSTHPVLTLIDTDGDGIPDEWERQNFPALSSPWCDPNADTDGDGLTNLVESYFSSNPNAADSDGDGLLDALEMQAGTNPQLADSDGDGIPDLTEVNAGSGGSSGATNPAQTSWPEMRTYTWGQWYPSGTLWSHPYLDVGSPEFKIGWTSPADKDFHLQVALVTMVSTGEEEVYEIENVETLVMTIPKGALESNAISTFEPIGSPRYKFLLATHVEFRRPEELRHAVPWGLSDHERIIPRPEMLNGIWARVNNDDDNLNGIPDAGDTSNPVENDLIKARLWVTPYMNEFIIRKPAGIRIWGDKDRTDLVSDAHETDKAIFPFYSTGEFWIECVAPVTSGDLEFSQRFFGESTEVPILKTPIRTFDKLAVGVSGEVQMIWNGLSTTPADWNREARGQGLFEVCRNLYLKGYNIHYFAEPQIYPQGANAGYGPVFDEIFNQTSTGGSVNKVLAFGYSHGASGCWQMLNKLSTSLVAGSFTVPLTGYVDAITRNSFTSETRYPALSTSHWNAYQRNDWGLKGNVVVGAWPGAGGANVSHLGVVHAGSNGIHHHPTVKKALETEVDLKLK